MISTDFIKCRICHLIRINSYKPIIYCLHSSIALELSDLTPGYDAKALGSAYLEVPLGQGDVNWDGYFRTLKKIGYDGFLTIEREVGDTPKADIQLAVDFLKARMW